MRPIKFRGKRLDNGEWVEGSLLLIENLAYIYDGDSCPSEVNFEYEFIDVDPATVGQYTGLQDKNSNARIFEGDLLSLSGTLIGNQYENEDLLKDRTNLLIEGLCTKEWIGTYQEAIKRGCVDAK